MKRCPAKPGNSVIARLSRFLITLIPCVLVAVSTTTLAQPQPERISPAAPVLREPPADQTVHLVHPANTSLIFTWQPGTGGLTPTRYQVCVTEEQRSCTDAGAWIFPFTGQPALPGTTYTARLPATFQGKRLHWTVAACAPNPFPSPLGLGELCTYATPRLLIWALPAPHLGTPADNTNTSLRPTLTIRENVPGADRYLFCLAKPGRQCPEEATVTPELIVAEVRGALQYTPPRDLAQYRNQTMQWTAAACNASGCVYQTPRQVTLLDTSQVACADRTNEVQVQNGRYVARIPKTSGSFTVRRLLPNGGEEPAATADVITFRLGSSPSWMTDSGLIDKQVTVEKCHSFYARVKVEGSLMTSPWGRLQVTKTYEFTRSSHVYEQLALRFMGTQFVIPMKELIWQLSVTDPRRVSVAATTDDFVVRFPTLGSSQPGLTGTVSPCMPQPACMGPNRAINLERSGSASPGIDLGREEVLLANRAISINVDQEPPLDFVRYPYAFSRNEKGEQNGYQFYTTFGMREFDGKYYYFNHWDQFKYAMENVSPIPREEISRQTEDWLIRLTMFVVERLAQDQGWWKFHEWTGGGGVQFPRGDRFTDDARSFPALAYVWAYLTMRRTPQGWIHVPGDADGIYRQLQQTYSWYLESDPSVTSITPNPAHNFADRSPSGTPYLAYSQHLKERYGPDSSETVKGVINAHCTALHWAWLMAEASRLYGDPVREGQWRAVVTRYHEGSKEMFHSAYPDRRYFGLIPYQRHQRELTDAQKMNYVDITFSGIPAGYLNGDTFEPEFADVVERASRLDTDPFPCNREAPEDERDPNLCNPDGTDLHVSWADSSYVWRLIRVFPAALAFARSEETISQPPRPSYEVSWGSFMSRDLSTASLSEVLAYNKSKADECLYDPNKKQECIHDPAKFISEGDGRKWILTNTKFQSYWSPGFWEEVEPARVPSNLQFALQVRLPTGLPAGLGHYSAYRMGNKFFIMTDYTGGTLTLELPGSQLPLGLSQLSTKRRTYNANTGRWAPEQLATGIAISPGPSGKVLVQLQQVQRKALTIMEIQP
jgi:hypothetical protein